MKKPLWVAYAEEPLSPFSRQTSDTHVELDFRPFPMRLYNNENQLFTKLLGEAAPINGIYAFSNQAATGEGII